MDCVFGKHVCQPDLRLFMCEMRTDTSFFVKNRRIYYTPSSLSLSTTHHQWDLGNHWIYDAGGHLPLGMLELIIFIWSGKGKKKLWPILLFDIYLLTFIFVHVHTCLCAVGRGGGQRATCGSWFSPSMWACVLNLGGQSWWQVSSTTKLSHSLPSSPPIFWDLLFCVPKWFGHSLHVTSSVQGL